MFRQQEWVFTGASGKKYFFTIHPKSEGLPQSGGVFILAYTRLRGHMAGWQVNPLFIGNSDDIAMAVENGEEPPTGRCTVWNSNFICLEPNPSAREECVRDLKMRGPDYIEIKIG